MAYEFFTQAYILYEEEISVISNLLCSIYLPLFFSFTAGFSLVLYEIKFEFDYLIGLQSTGDCYTLDNRDSSEDACIWC